MRRIAHLSDVHMLDPDTRRSKARYRVATKAVSLGRPIDPRARVNKLTRGLEVAKNSGADHVVISGDLTELGDAIEFETFANVLHDAKMAPGTVTLVPGNHDAYTTDGAWTRALRGPLAAWASSSAELPGKVVDRGDVILLPIDTSRFQSIAFSRGEFTHAAARAIESRLVDPAFRDKALVLVLHHPPAEKKTNAVWQWIDALRGGAHVLDLLARHTRAQLLHGHLHTVVDRIVDLGKRARIFGAPAIVDDRATPRVRIYDVRDGMIESAGLFST